jgi:hypothetical protein
MAEVPRPPVDITIEWNDPDEPDADWDEAEDGPWTSTGSWSIAVVGHGEVLRTTEWSNDDGFPTLADAVTAAEKWATDRRLDIRLFGVTMRAVDSNLRGEG